MKMLDNRLVSMEVALKLRKLKVRNPERLAMIVNFFHYHISNHKRAKKHRYEGRTWNYATLLQIQQNLYCLDLKQIEYCMNLLVELKIFVKGNFNKYKYDRTCWYAFYNEKEWPFVEETALEDDQIEEAESYEHFVHKSVDKQKSDSDQSEMRHPPVGNEIPTSRKPIPQYTHRNNDIHNTVIDRDVKISSKGDYSDKVDKGKIGEVKNPKQCFNLSFDQLGSFNELKEKFPDTLDGTIAKWVKQYDLKMLLEAYKITQKRAKSNKGAFMTRVLTSLGKRDSVSFKKNQNYFDYIINNIHLSNYEIREDAVFIFTVNSSEEVPFTLNHKTFVEKINNILKYM